MSINQLVTTSASGEDTVNARDLHEALEVGRDFSTWMQHRIEQYGFVEGEDYVVDQNLSSPKVGSSKSRAQKVTDYHLSLDMAKELSMVENTPKGKQVRKAFIKMEKKYIALLEKQAEQVELAEMNKAWTHYLDVEYSDLMERLGQKDKFQMKMAMQKIIFAPFCPEELPPQVDSTGEWGQYRLSGRMALTLVRTYYAEYACTTRSKDRAEQWVRRCVENRKIAIRNEMVKLH